MLLCLIIERGNQAIEAISCNCGVNWVGGPFLPTVDRKGGDAVCRCDGL